MIKTNPVLFYAALATSTPAASQTLSAETVLGPEVSFTASASKFDAGRFANFYQHNSGGPALFSEGVVADRNSVSIRLAVPGVAASPEQSLVLTLGLWRSDAQLDSSTYVRSGQTNTVSLDGVYITTDRFSNADLDSRLSYSDNGFRFMAGIEQPATFLSSSARIMIGAFAERLQQEWQLDTTHTYNAQMPSPLNGGIATAWIDEELDVWRGGVAAALDVSLPLSQSLELQLGGDIEVYGQFARLTGEECTPQAFGPCDGRHFPRTLPGLPYHSQARDDDLAPGGRARLKAGIVYSLTETVSLSFGGFAEMTVNAPRIRNPVYTDPDPASVEHFFGTGWGGNLGIRMVF
jgi:hypothetical protein